MTKPSDATFIIHDPAHSVRKSRIERAKALSHAAKVVHKRRQGDRRQVPASTSGTSFHTQQTDQYIRPTDRRACDVSNSSFLLLPGYGNSDPFDSMPVPITPQNSRLPLVWQAHVASNRMTHTRKISSALTLQNLYVEDALHLKCLFYIGSALLSSVHGQHQGLQHQTLKHRVSCYESLNHDISLMSQPSTRMVLLRRLSLIMTAAILTSERFEAEVHARRLYDEISKAYTADSWLSVEECEIILTFVHYYDNICAMVYLDSPVLDVKRLERLWDSRSTIHNQNSKEHANIEWWRHAIPSPSCVVSRPIFSQQLEHNFSIVQQCINNQAEAMSKAFWDQSTKVVLSSPMWHTYLTNALLDHLTHARSQYAVQSGDEPRFEISKKHAEVILSSTLLAFFTCVLAGPVIFPLRKNGQMIMKVIRTTLEQTSVPLHECFDASLFRDAQLWALYLGATWEFDSGVYRLGEAWFIPRLQFLVHELGLTCWADLIGICDKFLYIRADQVYTSAWFLGMDWPEDLWWAGSGQRQQTSSEFLKELLFGKDEHIEE